MTLVTFLVWPFRIAITCSVSLLKTTAFLSFPPVTIFEVSLRHTSTDKIPGTLALWRPWISRGKNAYKYMYVYIYIYIYIYRYRRFYLKFSAYYTCVSSGGQRCRLSSALFGYDWGVFGWNTSVVCREFKVRSSISMKCSQSWALLSIIPTYLQTIYIYIYIYSLKTYKLDTHMWDVSLTLK